MWVSSSISAVLGGKLPGPGTLYHAQTLRLRDRAHAGDESTPTVRLTEKGADRLAKLDTWVAKADGTIVVGGEAEVLAPKKWCLLRPTRAVALVHADEAQAVMKGHLHTDILLGHVVKRDGGLRIGHRLSHVVVIDVPGLEHLLMVTDAAINIALDLQTKADIVQNVIDLEQALGIDTHKVSVLSAVEVVNPAIPSTLDAAILSKMADRGQIKGGLVDRPLSMDNAINLGAARTKGIVSSVAARTEILVAPNLESGNMLAKEMSFLAHAESGGIVMGAKCPVILTSCADDEKAYLASCAIAALYSGSLHK